MEERKERKLILFVEDDVSTIEVYKITLEQAGFMVEVLTSGQEAIDKIAEIDRGEAVKPDLVLLDYILPDIDGLQILKEIRKRKNTKDLKVFIATNYSVEKLKQDGKFVDGEKFILKADYTPSKMADLVRKEINSER
jgi:CheY-like chemotaxis protein